MSLYLIVRLVNNIKRNNSNLNEIKVLWEELKEKLKRKNTSH
jgi:hypothetical protein